MNMTGGDSPHGRRVKEFELRLGAVLMGLLLWSSAASGSAEYLDQWGPALGIQLPTLQVPDETGAVRTLDDLTGDEGLLLVLVRSADW